MRFHDHLPNKYDPWHGLERAALEAHQILVNEAGAFQEPDPKCPEWAHRAAMLLLEALDDIQAAREGEV